MVYNIFCSSFQIKDNIFTNIRRYMLFYNNCISLLKKYDIYGANITKICGLYEGKKEKSFLIQIIGNYHDSIIKSFCHAIREENNQDSVLLQLINTSLLIYKDKEEAI